MTPTSTRETPTRPTTSFEAGSDDEFTQQITESAKVIGIDTNGNNDDEWAVDTSAETDAARAKELSSVSKRSHAFCSCW
ncbi:eukaryotic translation initiation factor 5 [Exophiala xenobiotica]|nr:eukaryotic translation initiation factor 5 [Exophiala xenobiotica]